jgi:hypothetical protein
MAPPSGAYRRERNAARRLPDVETKPSGAGGRLDHPLIVDQSGVDSPTEGGRGC